MSSALPIAPAADAKLHAYRKFYVENASFAENKKELLSSHVLQSKKMHVTQSAQHAAFQALDLSQGRQDTAATKEIIFTSSIPLLQGKCQNYETSNQSVYKELAVNGNNVDPKAWDDQRAKLFDSKAASVFRGKRREFESTTKSAFEYRGMDPSAKSFTNTDFQISHISFGRDRDFASSTRSDFVDKSKQVERVSQSDVKERLFKSNLPLAQPAGLRKTNENHGRQPEHAKDAYRYETTFKSSFQNTSPSKTQKAGSVHDTLRSSVSIGRGKGEYETTQKHTFEDPFDVYMKSSSSPQRSASPVRRP
eukprot:ANDGO_03753.mRNA.1 hypothetical protein